MNSPFEVFPWSDTFATGIQEIDQQHQILIQFLNILASSMSFHSDMPNSRIIFMELTDYAAYHFKTEESVWHQYFADDASEAQHKKLHADFELEVNRLKNEESNLPLEIVLKDVVAFLTEWLKFHILDSDKRMARVVLCIQSGMSLDQAKQYVNQQIAAEK
jgi:hemerythrin-like metal-binding protein